MTLWECKIPQKLAPSGNTKSRGYKSKVVAKLWEGATDSMHLLEFSGSQTLPRNALCPATGCKATRELALSLDYSPHIRRGQMHVPQDLVWWACIPGIQLVHRNLGEVQKGFLKYVQWVEYHSHWIMGRRKEVSG